VNVRAIIAAAALACSGLSAAEAADPGQLECPTAGLSEVGRSGFADNVATLGPQTDPHFQSFQRAVAQCTERYGWSAEQARIARIFNISAVGQAELRRILEDMGVALAEIEQAVLADGAFMAAARAGNVSGAVIGGFIRRHTALIERILAGRSREDNRGELVGRYILFRAMMEATRDQFLAS
jgi:hypothetical protein